MATRPARNCPVVSANYTSEDAARSGAVAPIVLQFESAGTLARCIAGDRDILNTTDAIALVSQRLKVPERTARTLLRRLARAPTGPANDEALTALGWSALSWRQAEGDDAATQIVLFPRETHSAAEDRLNAILDNAADAIFVIDVNGVIENANPAAHALGGWPPGSLVGEPLSVLMSSNDAHTHQVRVTRYLETGGSGILNAGPRPLSLTRRDGGRVSIELSVGEATIGGARKFIGVCRDIDERLRVDAALTLANQRLRQQVEELRVLGQDLTARKRDLQERTREAQAARQEAEQASQAKSRFMAIMSHELRTPLNGVLAVADALAKRPLPAAELEMAKLIKSSGDALLSILNEVLDLARVESGALSLDPAPIDLGQLVLAITEVWRFAAEAKDLKLHVECVDLPEAALADGHRLRQVLSNLLSNAIKFTERGAVSLRAAGDRNSDRVTFSVSDSGPGIAPCELERLFEPFVQGDASTTRRHGGAGLGLAICRELVAMMGGDIRAEPGLQTGSTFTVDVTLPRVSPSSQTPTPSASPDPIDFDPLILVAEDHPLNRRVIAILLDEAGLRYEFAEDGLSTVAAAASGRFDLILMDVHMPQLDGLEATRRIRRLGGEVAATPIIAVTANASSEEIAECLDAGMDGFVGKPINACELLSAVANTARVPRSRGRQES